MMIRLSLLLLLAISRVKSESKTDALWTMPKIEEVLYKADIPEHLWSKFAAVAACESQGRKNATGDGGAAFGLYQIHWHLWAPWAEGLDLGRFDEPFNPVQNARLALIIQEYYSIPRHQGRWEQWENKPEWSICQQKAKALWGKEE